jgi:hypothetical protein
MIESLQNMPGLGEAIKIATDYGRNHAQFLGGLRAFENKEYGALVGKSSLPRPLKDGAWIMAVLLKNNSGGALLGGNLARLDTSGSGTGGSSDGELYTQVAGYGNAAVLRTVVLIDPWLPTGGVPDQYAFWGIVKGPAPGRTPASADDFQAAVTSGGPVVCTADALGRISGVNAAPANQAAAQANALGVLGFAWEPAATTDVNQLVGVYWNIPIWG